MPNDDEMVELTPLLNVQQPLIAVYVDFPDGRKQPGNVITTQDSDISSVANIDAVGSMGYTKVNGVMKKKIRKFAELAIKQGETRENVIVDAIGPETYTYRELFFKEQKGDEESFTKYFPP